MRSTVALSDQVTTYLSQHRTVVAVPLPAAINRAVPELRRRPVLIAAPAPAPGTEAATPAAAPEADDSEPGRQSR